MRDHGPGIAPADLPHVFDRFYRAPAARGLPGSGLGLAIVAQVAHEEGGSVWAGEGAGGGAVLRLRLPTVAGSAPTPELGAPRWPEPGPVGPGPSAPAETPRRRSSARSIPPPTRRPAPRSTPPADPPSRRRSTAVPWPATSAPAARRPRPPRPRVDGPPAPTRSPRADTAEEQPFFGCSYPPMPILLPRSARMGPGMPNSSTPPSEASRRRQALGRDRAIGRVQRTTRWVVAGAVAGTGVLVGLAAHDVRGTAAGASNHAGASRARASQGLPTPPQRPPQPGVGSSPRLRRPLRRARPSPGR